MDQEPGRESAESAPPEREHAAEQTPFSQQVGRVVLGAIAIVFVAFAIDNLHQVAIEWVFGGNGGAYPGDGIPLILLLLGSFALGATVGGGLVWRRARRRARARPSPVLKDDADRS